ncbi:hypothetical protein [Streptomyces sp. NPDC017529]|uniref:hypothetical protein n=1 Tax=Streptomyces sp. NPDC017529 TaxID=3365000 RepID=UPI0037B7816E
MHDTHDGLLTEFEAGPDAADRLSDEMLALLGITETEEAEEAEEVAGPGGAEQGVAPEADGADDEDGEWPKSVGAVAVRRDGVLVGLGNLVQPVDDEPIACLDATFVELERRRLATGRYPADLTGPGLPGDAVLMARLLSAAAPQARALGFTSLEWSGLDTGTAGRAAAAVGAEVVAVLGRYWTVPLDSWQPPRDLPPLDVRRAPHPLPADVVERYLGLYTATNPEAYWVADELADHLAGSGDDTLLVHAQTADGTVTAQLGAVVEGHLAYADEPVHLGSGPRHLLALLDHLVTCLRAEHPAVTGLVVQELDDPATAEALAGTGAEVTTLWQAYKLPL